MFLYFIFCRICRNSCVRQQQFPGPSRSKSSNQMSDTRAKNIRGGSRRIWGAAYFFYYDPSVDIGLISLSTDPSNRKIYSRLRYRGSTIAFIVFSLDLGHICIKRYSVGYIYGFNWRLLLWRLAYSILLVYLHFVLIVSIEKLIWMVENIVVIYN